MQIGEAQQNMRDGYFHGAPGVLASALVWLCAGLVALARTPDASIAALYAGGMFIHPMAIVFCKLLGRGARASTQPAIRSARWHWKAPS